MHAHETFPRKGARVRRRDSEQFGEVYASDQSKDLITVRWRTKNAFDTRVCSIETFSRDYEVLHGMNAFRSIEIWSAVKGLIGMATVIGVCWFFVWFFFAAFGNQPPAPKPTEDQLNNAAFLVRNYGTEAADACADAADDYLRTIARYDFAWDPQETFEKKFGEGESVAKGHGVLMVWSRKAKLQNGFGAYSHIILTCDYDTQAKLVKGYNVVQ